MTEALTPAAGPKQPPVPIPKPVIEAAPPIQTVSAQADNLGPAYQAHVQDRQLADAAEAMTARVAARRAAKAAPVADAAGTRPPGAAPSAAPQPAGPGILARAGQIAGSVASGAVGAVEDVAYGATVGLPVGIVGGARDAAQNTLDLVNHAAGWLDKNVADLSAGPTPTWKLPEVGGITGTFTEGAIRTASQYLTAAAGAGKALAPLGILEKGGKLAEEVAKGAVAGFAAFDPKGAHLGDLWNTLGLPKNALTDALAANPGDSEAWGRFKGALDNVLPAAAVEGVTTVARAWSASLRAAQPTAATAAAAVDLAPKIKAEDLSALLGDTGGERLAGKARNTTAADATRKMGAATAQTGDLGVPPDVAAKGVARAEHTPEFYVNWARVDAPEDVQRAMSQMADSFGGDIEAARRGVQTFEQTKLGADAENAWGILVGRREGQPLNDKQSVAVRGLWAASAAKLSDLAETTAKSPSDENMFAFRKMLATHHMIQKEVIAARTETARALSSWRIPVGGDAERAREIQMLLAESGGTDVTKALAQRISALAKGGHIIGLDVAVEKGATAKTVDAVRELWINALLSSPSTHIVNTTSNISVAFQQIMERKLAEKVSGALGSDGGVAAGEAMAMTHGLMAGWKDALRYAGKALATGESGFGIGKVEGPRAGAISASTLNLAQGSDLGRAVDMLGQGIRTPTRALVAEDEFFKTLGYRMELHAQALRQATDDVQKGVIPASALKEQMATYIANPPENVRMASVDQALYQTFNQAPEKFARLVMQARDMVPGLFVLLPFVRTPGNIMKYTIERTPLAPVLGRFRQDVAAGGARRDLAMARMAAGSLTMATASDLAMSGLLTGGGPKDPVARAALPPGWQPYSVKAFDRYWSYNRMDAVGNLFGLAADMVDVLHNTDLDRHNQKGATDLMIATGLMAANGFVSKTYMQGLGRAVDALHDPERYGPAFFEGLSGSLIPGVVASSARALDPVSREVRGMGDALMARTPWLSDNLPPNRDLWGRAVPYSSGIGWAYDMFSPIKSSEMRGEPVDHEVAKQQVALTKPGRTVDFQGTSINLDNYPGAYSRYTELAGNASKDPAWGMGAKDYLNAVITGHHPMSPVYNMHTDGPDGGKQAFIRDTVSKARNRAKAVLVQEFPALRRDLSQQTSTPQIQGVPAMPKVMAPTLN